jgi:exportin-5
MALDRAQRYLANRRVHEISDWGSCQLDDEGLALQNELEERQKARFYPLWLFDWL